MSKKHPWIYCADMSPVRGQKVIVAGSIEVSSDGGNSFTREGFFREKHNGVSYFEDSAGDDITGVYAWKEFPTPPTRNCLL